MNRWLSLATLLSGFALASAPDPRPMNVMPDDLARSVWQHRMQNQSVQGQMASQMEAMLAPLRPLTGKAFDIKWTQLMIDHHQMALDMAQHELAMDKDARVKATAQQVIDAQRKEISMMQGWLGRWTGKNDMLQPMSQPMPMQMNMPGSADRWFLEAMIPHHQGAIDMARLIPSRTQNADLRKQGADIIHVQSAEIAQYREWLKTVK